MSETGCSSRRGRSGRRRQPALGGADRSSIISNDESDFYTIVDVSANDRIGLLYDLATTIGDLDFEIYISKAATIRDQAADTFYLKSRDGSRVRDLGKLAELQARLSEAALGRREATAGPAPGRKAGQGA